MFHYFRNAVLGVLLLCLTACPAYGVVLSYNETFDVSTGRWESGYLTPDYPLWYLDAYYNSGSTHPNVRMTEVAGTMTLAATTGDAVYAMLGADSLLPTATVFDLSAGDLVFEMELASNWRSDSTSAGSTHSGIRVNDLVFYFHPGYTGNPIGAFRIGKVGTNGFAGTIVGNQNMGFVPGSADADDDGNRNHTLVKMTVSQDGSDYLFKFESGLKENNNSYTYLYEYREPISNFGAGLSEVGIYSSNAFNTNVDNFSLSAPYSETDYAAVRVSDTGKNAWNNTIDADTPLHWYRFNETAAAGDTVLKDYGSGGKDGTLRSYHAANPDTVAYFNADTYIMLENGGTILAGDADGWSAEFILKAHSKSTGSAQGLVSMSGTGTTSLRSSQWNNFNEPGYTASGVKDYNFNQVVGGNPLDYDLDQWMHMVFVNTGTEMQLYIDGVLSGTSSDTIDLNMLYIGSIGTSAYFSGMFDEIAIYDYALTGETVGAHFAAYQNNAVVPEPATWLMLLLGLAGMVCIRRKR